MGAEPAKPCPLRIHVFKIPPGFLGPPSAPPQPDVARQLSAMDYLKAAGIEFPPGGEATFDPVHSALTVRATDEVIEMIHRLTEYDLSPIRQVRVVLGLAEFTLPNAEPLTGLTYERARALAGNSWRTLERTSLMAKNGEKTMCLYPGGKSEPTAPPTSKARPGAASATPAGRNEQLEIAPEISKDATTVNLEFSFDHGPASGQSPKRFEVMEKFALRNEAPTLVRATALPAAKGAQTTTVRALIVRASIVDEYGVRPPPVPEKPLPHHQ